MNKLKRGKYLLMTAYALSAGFYAAAQSPEDPKAVPAYRGAVISSMMDRIEQKHLYPKPVDDTFSANVWKRFLSTLDPNSDILLQEDVDMLAAYKTQIDDQLRAGKPDFFEAAWNVYRKRLMEAEVDYKELIAHPFSFDKKETVKHIRKEEAFSVDKAARKELWRKLLKYYVLRNYMEISIAADSDALAKSFNRETEVKARAKVKKYYDDIFHDAQSKRTADEKFDLFMNVVAMEFDAHTMFTGPKDRTFNEMINKRYFGLGIELENKEGEYYVRRLLPGGPAYMSGVVKESDHILSISNAQGEMMSISGMPNIAVVNMIRGEKGTSVKMQLQQAGEQARTAVVRRDEIIDTENKAKSAVIEKNGKRFGFIRLNDFYFDETGNPMEGSAADISRELTKLRDEEVEGIILDLRSNGGGALNEVVKMCGSFLPGSAISWLRGKTALNRYGTANAQAFYTGPLTVMVDESSASASEIFAAAIQDYKRGLIVGTKTTFGKGTAQQMVNLGKLGDSTRGTEDVRYGSMRLTIEKFYRTSGSSTQLKGVSSDIIMQSRMNWQSVMETDYPSVMSYDSVNVLPYIPVKPTTDFAAVIQKAQARIAANPMYAGVEEANRRLKALTQEPAALDLEGFKAQHRQWYDNTKKIQALRELPADKTLQVMLTTNRNINPLLRNDAERTKVNKDWLQKIAKDVYVAETISILEDMIANPVPATIENK
ncbi:carboxy terminal-processing peptidase [uncultured Chitinophaga sp.]|uniref:carboxy terminal-processing peptidase n=1 Tax=uncultured Chitinophaga sp. TaxID=339340 RepID=UPI0025D8DA4A|nr:carboxy terminal-processing peptidase [uncultured Chitinophaga sp.]